MPAINQSWYSNNANRSYPIDEVSTQVSDEGIFLPMSVIVDIQARFPSVSQIAFVSSVAITANVATVTILGATSPEDTGPYVPLAAVNVALPLDQGRQYQLEALYPGVGGWIVFGPGVLGPCSVRFSTPAQSKIDARCAKYYRNIEVSNASKYNSDTKLTGLITLNGGNDFEIVSECREFPGVDIGESCDDTTLNRNVIVFRLKDQSVNGTGVNVFDKYKGPCGGRPETRTCPDPQPIEFIESVNADCCGNLVLELRGCVSIIPFQDGHGAVLDCSLGLDEACTAPAGLPTADGTLPNEYQNICSDFSETITVPAESDTSEVADDEIGSSSVYDSGDLMLPFSDTFGGGTAPGFVVESGTFTFNSDDTPNDADYGSFIATKSYSTESPANSGSTAISVVDGGIDWLCMDKYAMTDLKILPGPVGSRHVGGVIVNYRPSMTDPTHSVYWAAEIDCDAKTLRLMYYNGTLLVPFFSVSVPDLTIGNWYRLKVTVQRASVDPLAAFVGCHLTGLSDAVNVTVSPVETTDAFSPFSGFFGVTSRKSAVRFGGFKIDLGA